MTTRQPKPKREGVPVGPAAAGATPVRPTRTGAAHPSPSKPDVDLEQVRRVAGSVKDPEVRTTLAELGLLDDVQVDEQGRVRVQFHLTSPLCPAKFAGQIGQQIRRQVARLPGVVSVEVILGDHFMAETLHQLINHGNHTAATKGVLR
jgi:metal-sulfur cluster biosynthetic enzyme